MIKNLLENLKTINVIFFCMFQTIFFYRVLCYAASFLSQIYGVNLHKPINLSVFSE